MHFPHLISRVLTLALFATTPLLAASPQLGDTLATENGAARVQPRILFGKTLVLPLLGSDADGDVLEFSVKTDNPKVFVRVKTGSPILRVAVSYPGDPNATPPSQPFSGVLEFQLFRDATPLTTGMISGAAQAGFYDNLIFHRVVPEFIVQGGDSAGTGSGDPGFDFDHEFRPTLIFSGRGQLAMANSNGGYDRGRAFGGSVVQLGGFSGTNNTQFFVTVAQPRHLDFKHTIFGQLLRGFDVLDKIEAVPTAGVSRPTKPVTITSATVVPGRADATLLLSAIDLGPAKITVTATDPSGARATQEIAVRVVEDTINDPPVLESIPNLVSPVGRAPQLPLKAFDLERDYQLFGIASANGNTQSGSFGAPQIVSNYTPRQTAGFQDLAVGVAQLNDPDLGAPATAANPFGPFDAYNFQVAEIAYGDRPISVSPIAADGLAGAALTSVILAEFRDADGLGQPSDFTATVIWGDGTPARATTDTSAPTITVERSSTTPGAFVVKGTHTYARPGVYRVQVTVDSALGATDRVLSTVVIAESGATLRATGRDLNETDPKVKNREVATFTDATSGAEPADFEVSIDWGDGQVSPGVVAAVGQGEFSVRGTHTFRDPERFAVHVHVRRISAPLASAVAWSSVRLNGFKRPQQFPPFSMPNLVGQISPVPVNADNPSAGTKTFKVTNGKGVASRTFYTCSLVVLNSGDQPSPEAELRFYLSTDDKFNKEPVNATTPADIPVKIGTFPKGLIPVLAPGGGLRYNFDIVDGNDLRLKPPQGETGAALTLLAVLDYHHPITDHMPISKDVPFGPIPGIIVNPTSLRLTEAAGDGRMKTFKVRLDRKPSATVKIPLTASDADELTISATELLFTVANWSQLQTVTVTAKDDTQNDDDQNSFVRLGPAESDDPLWDEMDGPDVSVVVEDNDEVTTP